MDELLVTIGDRLRVGDRVVELEIPWARGDVLAAVHREGEIVGEEAGDDGHPDPGRPRRGGQGPVRGVPGLVSPRPVTAERSGPGGSCAGFAPPPYPYERLNGAKAVATERFADRGGLVDCSIGTPCDPPPAAVLAAMATSGTERGYPTSPGSPAYRNAAAGWIERRFGVDGRPRGCRWRRAWAPRSSWPPPPSSSACARPDRDTVLYPSVSYPTYAMGATLAGARAVAVPELAGGGLDLDGRRSGRRRRGHCCSG